MNKCPWKRHALGYAPGFTLLELAVVLFLIGLVMMIAMPHFAAFGDAQLRSEARRLASHANYLYQEAGAQKVMLRLNFDLDHDRYVVTRLDPFAPEPVFMPERGAAGAVVEMPTSVHIRDVSVEGVGTFRRGTVGVQFYPGGAADAAVIHLVDRVGTVFTLAIDPFSGRVSVARGDLGPTRTGRLSQ
jgi:general secretion pathway protein H